MKKSWCAVLAALALAGTSVPAASPARACEEEGPGFVLARIETTLAPEDAARIVVEKYDGTLAIKGIVLHGTASWREGDTELAAGPVTVEGTYLTTGDETTALENRGILWLRYAFADAATAAAIGSGEGFVTLERVAEGWGAASFQGTITIGGVARQFAGLGWTGLRGLLPPLSPPPVPAVGCGDDDCDGEEVPGLVQEMLDTVLTGAKPGFEFETARTVTQLDQQFQKAERKLTRERDRRRKVIRAVR